MTYEMRMYDLGREANKRSAHAIVEVLYEMFHPQSVIDVGCGEGWFLDEFAKRGVKRLVGVDGNALHIAAGEFLQRDLSQPLTLNERFDLVLCLEVAEHVEVQYADTLVESLCELGDTVVFSAAIPKQGGHGHVNEQWPSYWFDKFNARDYGPHDQLRRVLWDSSAVESWYSQNIIVYQHGAIGTMHGPLNLVHPRLWCSYRGCDA